MKAYRMPADAHDRMVRGNPKRVNDVIDTLIQGSRVFFHKFLAALDWSASAAPAIRDLTRAVTIKWRANALVYSRPTTS